MKTLRVLCRAADLFSTAATTTASSSAQVPCVLRRQQIHSSSRRFDDNEHAGNEPVERRHEDFVAQLEALRPSATVQSQFTARQKEIYEKIWKEIELFVYLGKFIPSYLEDSEWLRLLESKTVSDRVTTLEYVALKQRRKEKDQLHKESASTAYAEYLEAQRKLFESGGMGYGPEMNQLVSNPFRNSKKLRHFESNKVVSAMRVGEPTVALDLQSLDQESFVTQRMLGKHVQYILSENYQARNPLPIAFTNCRNDEIGNQWFQRRVGFYSGEFKHQSLLPECSYLGPRQTFPDAKRIVYISRFAREMLSGPLTDDVICVGVTYDHRRETLGAARKSKVRPVALPIKKYIKWQSGPMHIPLPNILRILRHVNSSGGDWETAIRNNISQRHLKTDEERLENGGELRKMLHQRKVDERNELIRAIQDATS